MKTLVKHTQVILLLKMERRPNQLLTMYTSAQILYSKTADEVGSKDNEQERDVSEAAEVASLLAFCSLRISAYSLLTR